MLVFISVPLIVFINQITLGEAVAGGGAALLFLVTGWYAWRTHSLANANCKLVQMQTDFTLDCRCQEGLPLDGFYQVIISNYGPGMARRITCHISGCGLDCGRSDFTLPAGEQEILRFKEQDADDPDFFRGDPIQARITAFNALNQEMSPLTQWFSYQRGVGLEPRGAPDG